MPVRPDVDLSQVAWIRYRNWKGETANRHIFPTGVRFAATEWHPEPQWLLDAWDMDKDAYRSFAMRDIIEWLGPDRPAETQSPPLMSKREYIGCIFTDVAAVIVGDPCKLIPDEGESPKLPYLQFAEALYPLSRDSRDWLDGWQPGQPIPDRPPAPPSPQYVEFGPHDAIAIKTVDNCDGWLKVYIERDKQGQPMRLIVDLSAGPEPGQPASEPSPATLAPR